MNDLVNVLTAGRQMIVANGWVRGVYQGECGYCAVGAIRVSAPAQLGWYTLEDRAVKLLAECLPAGTEEMAGPFSTVFNWNDNVAADVGDVLSLFDRAIERAGE